MSSSRRQYPFHLIEPKWQKVWDDQQAFRAFNPGDDIPAAHPFAQRHQISGRVTAAQLPPKFYILDMFPYPSGAGLHVGHPEGYTATDILARYRRARGFNVLHPMGWDSFGLPAEQYAVKTGQHPRKTTEENIATFKRQIKSLGFSYDWSRELATTDPGYFKWTQWIFLKLYNSWFNPKTNKTEPIETLDLSDCITEEHKRIRRATYRLAYVTEAPVWWCEDLGTVLANEEVVDGKSEVGGFPVVRKPMRQWMLRITAYAERLIKDLDTIDWTSSLKEMQRNWIGRSEGAEIDFKIADCALPTSDLEKDIRVFTTRPDTLFGATYMVLAPEHKLVDQLLERAKRWQNFVGKANQEITASTVCLVDKEGVTQVINLKEALSLAKEQLKDLIEVDSQATPPVCRIGDFGMYKFDLKLRAKEILDQRANVEAYRSEISKKSDLERTELAKEKTGVFTGAYAVNPVHGGLIPIWIADYVLASYGTGAIMAVPAHDTRDFEFATKFNLPILQVVEPLDKKTNWRGFTGEGTIINSANFEIGLDGLPIEAAKKKITDWLQEKGVGHRTINYKLRDWLFSRQRYWGEPFPIVWKKDATGQPHHEALLESALPVLPPELTDYKPTATGEPPLARAKDWVNLPDGAQRETNTMPQWAGSCWYYLRYLDAKNSHTFVSPEAEGYWMSGSEVQELKGSRVEAETSSSLQPSNILTKPGVDLYVGGTEHAVLHLLYARFWHKVLFDLGLVSTPEPFFKLVNQGLILGEMEYYAFSETPTETSDNAWVTLQEVTDIVESGPTLVGKNKNTGQMLVGIKIKSDRVENDGPYFLLKDTPGLKIRLEARCQKMSKSRGNVVNPDDVIRSFGTDSLRLFEMFMGPLEMVKPWSTKGVEGVYRFLGRVWRLFVDEKSETEFEQAETTTESAKQGELLKLIRLDGSIKDVAATPAQLKTLHACIKKVTEDLEGLRFNTAISALMVFVNEAMTWETKPVSVLRDFLILLQPFAPHLAEELWAKLSPISQLPSANLAYSPWPKFDPALLVESTMKIPVQVNGKLRDVIKVPADISQTDLETAAKNAEKAKPFIEGKTIKKVIVVPKKLVNLIVV